jgi:Bacterial archaeo-eukaryotic release factor family 2
MPDTPLTLPLLKIGRLELDPALRAFQPGPAVSDLVVTATVEVPDSASERQQAWDVAWADATREAIELGVGRPTADALATGAGQVPAAGSRVVVAARGAVLLARWLPPGWATNSVRAGPLPHLMDVAAAAARRPAYVVLLADRDGATVIAHTAGDQHPARRFPVGARPGAQRGPHPQRPPALHHGPRHVTGSEPESGGERNAEFAAGRVSEAAASVGAHIVLGAGDQQILGAISAHLPGSLGPVATIATGSVPADGDAQLSTQIWAALSQITARAIDAIGDLVAAGAAGPEPAAVHGIEAVVEQLAEQQVAVLLVGESVSAGPAVPAYRVGSQATELIAASSGPGLEVPLEDGLVWAALNQNAAVVQLPDGTGPLAGQPAAALLRRGPGSQNPRRQERPDAAAEPEHLSNRHRDTLRQIFRHPVSHNIEWHAVLSLLEAVGEVTVRHDGKVAVRLGAELEFLDPPAGKDIDTQMVIDLRRMLNNAGYAPR